KAGTNSWSFEMQPAKWAGDGKEIQLAANVTWPQRGTFECEAKGLDARMLRDFIPQTDTEAMLGRLNFSGGWTNRPLAFALESEATLRTKEQFPFSAEAKIAGGTNGIAIEQLSVFSETQTVCRAEGTLPVVLDPTQTNLLQIDADAPLRLKMLT